MKKILYIALFFLLSLSSVSARWYGNHALSYNTSPNIQNCDEDGDISGGVDPITWLDAAVANNNSAVSLIPEDIKYPLSATGSIRCLYWDGALPVVDLLSYTDAWVNTLNNNISFRISDAWWSKLKRYVLQMRTSIDTPNFTIWSGWNNVLDVTNTWMWWNFNGVYPLNWENRKAYQFRLRVWDIAGNYSAWYNPWFTLKIDTDTPVAWDIFTPFPAPGNQLAINNLNTYIDVNDGGGAPIVLVQWFFERYDSNNTYTQFDSNNDVNPWNTSRLQINWNIQDVDGDGSPNNGQRRYKSFISYIEDAAGNSIGIRNSSSIKIREFNYEVFADTINISTKSLISENLSNTTNIADGTQKNLQVQLADQYGNKIIPVTSIGRTVDFHVVANNGLYLNQYGQTGTSALYMGNNTNSIPIWFWSSAEITNMSSTDGVYNIPIFVYTPTYNIYNKVPGWADITDIQFDINRTVSITVGDNPQWVSLTAFPSFPVSAWPLYSTQFSWELKTQWFIEWSIQNSYITINKDLWSSVSPTSKWVFLEFWAQQQWNLILTATPGGQVAEDKSLTTLFQANTWFTWIKPLSTFLVQSATIKNLQDSFLATIIKYMINGKEVIYPSDIINKNSYYAVNYTWWASQVGIKIIWNTASTSTWEVVTNQFNTDVRIIGKVTKSIFRREIQRNAYQVIRNIANTINGNERVTSLWGTSWNNGSSEWWMELLNGKVLYFKNPSSWVIELQGGIVTWKKTLIVENGNVYITWNIVNGSGNDILWIIVLNGNLYINPSVTDIHAIIYSDKSIISYDTVELDGNNSTASQLANQLYIYGSIFSENTIGGSRKAIPECPYYVNTSCNTSQEAQKYDLNYLRRYFMYDSNNDGILDTPSWAQSSSRGQSWFDIYPVIIDYNPQVQQIPPPFFD